MIPTDMLKTFYLVISPGLEDLAQKELLEKTALYKLEIISPKLTRGGISFECSLESGFKLNQILKIPTRILLRIDEFKVRDFPRLFNKLRKIKWSDYLCGELPQIKASTKESRLIHTGRMSETTIKAIKKFYAETPLKKFIMERKDTDPGKTIYMRVENDLLTLSIDTSGDALYKRNNWAYRAPAALRETFSSGIFYEFKNTVPQKITTLLDPFAGSGTLLVEALNFDQVTKREFSFKNFPIFFKAPFRALDSIKEYELETLTAQEIDKEVFNNSKDQLSLFKSIEYKNVDSFKEQSQADYILCNPPYGIRSEQAASSLKELINKLSENYQFKYLGILHPDRFKSQKNLTVISERKFSNNSIDVYFSIIASK